MIVSQSNNESCRVVWNEKWNSYQIDMLNKRHCDNFFMMVSINKVDMVWQPANCKHEDYDHEHLDDLKNWYHFDKKIGSITYIVYQFWIPFFLTLIFSLVPNHYRHFPWWCSCPRGRHPFAHSKCPWPQLERCRSKWRRQCCNWNNVND